MINSYHIRFNSVQKVLYNRMNLLFQSARYLSWSKWNTFEYWVIHWLNQYSSLQRLKVLMLNYHQLIILNELFKASFNSSEVSNSSQLIVNIFNEKFFVNKIAFCTNRDLLWLVFNQEWWPLFNETNFSYFSVPIVFWVGGSLPFLHMLNAYRNGLMQFNAIFSGHKWTKIR